MKDIRKIQLYSSLYFLNFNALLLNKYFKLIFYVWNFPLDRAFFAVQ